MPRRTREQVSEEGLGPCDCFDAALAACAGSDTGRKSSGPDAAEIRRTQMRSRPEARRSTRSRLFAPMQTARADLPHGFTDTACTQPRSETTA